MKEQRFYCIGIHKRCNVKEKDETEELARSKKYYGGLGMACDNKIKLSIKSQIIWIEVYIK